MWLLEQLTRSVSEIYNKDKTRPGVVISKLEDGYYISVARYASPLKKIVVLNTRGHGTLEEAVRVLTIGWCLMHKLPFPERPNDKILVLDRFRLIELE